MCAREYFLNKIESKYDLVFLDVGAKGGIPLKWNRLKERMKIIAFEPDLREFSKLKSNNTIRYLNCALNDKTQDLKLYITKETGKTSTLIPNTDLLAQFEDSQRFHVIKEENIPAERVKNLNSLIKENEIPDIDFIKLDTQGSELKILQGAGNVFFGSIFGTQIEVEFIEMYKNQPVFRAVDEFMTGKGFQLIDLRRHYWKRRVYYNYPGKGQLIFGDALYFKKVDSIFQELSDTNNKSYARAKIFKAILICLIYKIFDYAFLLAKSGFEYNYLTNEEYKEAAIEIRRESRKPLYSVFHLNARVYNALSSVLKKIRPMSYLGWADSDNEIGNIKDI